MNEPNPSTEPAEPAEPAAPDDALGALYALLVTGSGSAEPRAVAAALAKVPAGQRHLAICRFADAVIARTGDMRAADAAHRDAAAALETDAEALCVVLCSWLGTALNRHDLALLLELRERGAALSAAGRPAVAAAIVATVDAAGLLAGGRFADAEAALLVALAGPVPAPLRGAIAFLRSLALQARGLLDASVQVLDADAAHLGVFDLAAEMMRARRQWVVGEHMRARSMLALVHAEARARGRQHDGDYAAAMGRLLARLDGDAPDLPPATPSTPPVAALIAVEQALALAGDPVAAAAFLRDRPEAARVSPEFLAVPYVLSDELRPMIDAAHPGDEPSDSLAAARALVALRSGGAAPEVEPWRRRNLYRPWADELGPSPGTPAASGRARGAAAAHAAASAVAAGPSCMCGCEASAAIVRVLGPVSVVVHGEVRAVRRERVRALLALLALHRRVSRERLIDVLWPDLAPAAGANNLRTTLSYARRVAPQPLLLTEGRMVALVADVDLWRLDAAAGAARAADASGGDGAEHWCAAADAVSGRFADDVVDAAWLDAARWSADSTATDALLRAAACLVQRRPAQARDYAERALRIDPWSERALVLIAHSWVEQGDVGAARRAAQRAAQMLTDLGLAPGDVWSRILPPSGTDRDQNFDGEGAAAGGRAGGQVFPGGPGCRGGAGTPGR